MMIQEFISNCISTLVWIAFAAVCSVLVGVGLRYIGGWLMAALLETTRKYGVWVASPLLAVALVCTVDAQKSGVTNAPPDGVSGSNVVTQIEEVTNGRICQMESVRLDGTFLHSPHSSLHLVPGLPPQDPPAIEPFAIRSANAVVNHWWRGRGAHVDGFTIPAIGWNFRTPSGFLESLLVYSYGEIQPDVETTYFPRPFPEADLSLLPEGKWGELPYADAESVFWHASSPSNSLILTWQNAAYGRDANCPTNLQIELFSNGTYVYRYGDRTEHHTVAYPFDLDGDGLENSVDPEPLVAGPDAHGTNAEWYNTVCSNVFSRIEPSNNQTIHLPNGGAQFFKSGVNTNAYYFVDVVAERGPAPIYFNSSHPGRLGSPIVVALGGETNCVPLLVGATYSVSSDVPFTVSCPTNGFAGVAWYDGTRASVKWPLEFSFTEGISGTSRIYTVEVEPYNPGGTFSWGGGQSGAILQGVSFPTGGGVCGCVSGSGNTVTFGCSPTCTCGGNCLAVGAFTVENAHFAVTGGVCRCGFDDPPLVLQPVFDLNDGPSFTITFNKSAVVYEDEFEDRPEVFCPKRSTRVRLTISAYGGQNGGTFILAHQNLERLVAVSEAINLPSSKSLLPGESFFATCVYEAETMSETQDDVSVAGIFSETGLGTTILSHDELTIVKVEFQALQAAPQNRCVHRHKYGIGERMLLIQTPSTPELGLDVFDATVRGFGMTKTIEWGVTNGDHSLVLSLMDIDYRPRLEVSMPIGIVGCEVLAQTNGLVAGEAGGLKLRQRYRVIPLDVDFQGISVEEVPCTDVIPPTGYFVYSPTNRFFRSHTYEAGAGRWIQVVNGNYVGDSQIRDGAGYLGILPRMKNDGTVTTNTAFGWLDGSLVWKVPFGWKGAFDIHTSITNPIGRFAEGTLQEMSINPRGDFSIKKLKHTAVRQIDGAVSVDGKSGDSVIEK